MKKYIVYKLIAKMNSDQKLRKRLKYVGIFAALSFLIFVPVFIWASLSFIQYAGGKIESLNIRNPISTYEDFFSGSPDLFSEACVQELRDLSTISSWIANPVLKNIETLKTACIERNGPPCDEPECSGAKPLLGSPEGTETI